jgi:hypothetical protein
MGTEQVVGRSWFYYVIQGATLVVLVLAANTSYADFPCLSAIPARNAFVPHLFGFRGDRLAFSVGIIALSILAGGCWCSSTAASTRWFRCSRWASSSPQPCRVRPGPSQ